MHYELVEADPRTVAPYRGRGTLTAWHPLGADVRLAEMHKGELVIVRMNYFPAWTAAVDAAAVPLFEHEGQLAFLAPHDGGYVVRLAYPGRQLLIALALGAFLARSLVVSLACAPRTSPSVIS